MTNFKKKKCVICGIPIVGFGNNAQPVARGRCCDDCNGNAVIPARIAQIHEQEAEQPH